MNDKEQILKARLNAVEAIEGKSIVELLSVLNGMRQKMLLAVIEAGELSPANSGRLKDTIARIMELFRGHLVNAMNVSLRRMFVKGIQLVDKTLESSHAAKLLPVLPERSLQRIQQDAAGLIAMSIEEARKMLVAAIDSALQHPKPAEALLAMIGTDVQQETPPGKIARCIAAIQRIEGMRAYQLAIVERLQQHGIREPRLEMQWLDGDRCPKQGHYFLDGVAINCGERFRLLGSDGTTYNIFSPYDPALPLAEVDGCVCKVAPAV